MKSPKRLRAFALCALIFSLATPALAEVELYVPSAQEIEVNQTLTFEVYITGQFPPLRLDAVNPPEGATFTLDAPPERGELLELRGTFEWTPTGEQVGTFNVSFVGGEGKSPDVQATVEITVFEPANELTLNVPDHQSVAAETTVTFAVSATAVASAPALTMETGPEGAVFVLDEGRAGVSGTFTWTPTLAQVGEHSAVFKADDGTPMYVDAQVNITVRLPPSPPTISVPPVVESIVGEQVSFPISAEDANGDAITLAVTSQPLEGAVFHDNGDGTGLYTITPTMALENSSQQIVFSATGGEGEEAATATAATQLNVGFAAQANPPRVTVPGVNRAIAAVETAIVVESFDPDGGSTSVTLVSAGGLPAVVRPAADPDHFVVAVTPRSNQVGQRFEVEILSTDESSTTASETFFVDVVAASSAQTIDIEVRWLSIDAADPFSEPQGVEVFEAPKDRSQITGDPGDFLGYAIYASTEEEFEPSEENLVSLANPSWRNDVVTITVPDGKDGKPVTVRVAGRRKNGTGRPSKETSTDLPRFPSIPALLKGKLVLPAVGSNLLPGAQLEVRTDLNTPGERFTFTQNKKGTKYVIKRNAVSAPGGVKFSDAIRPGNAAVLILVNENGKRSAPLAFVP